MKQTLLQEPENFYFYNNGIKILCESIKREAKDSTTNTTGLFTLQGICLVNGAQTAGTIGSVYLQSPEQVVKAYVMVQSIGLSNVQTNAAAQITKLTNTQNRIGSKDFASLDAEQDWLRTPYCQ